MKNWLDKYNDHIPSAQGGDTIRSKSLGELEANVNAFGIHLPYFVSKNFPELRDRIPDPSLVGLDDLSDALRHAGAASDFAGEKWYNKLPLPARILIPNLAGLAHELDPRVGQNLPTQTASDLYNNFMGSLVGAMVKNDSIRGRMIGEMAKKNMLSDLSDKSSLLGKFNKNLVDNGSYKEGGNLKKISDKQYKRSENYKKYDQLKTNADLRQWGIDYYNDPSVLRKLYNNITFPEVLPFDEEMTKNVASNIQNNLRTVKENLSSPFPSLRGNSAFYTPRNHEIYYDTSLSRKEKKDLFPHEALGHASGAFPMNLKRIESILEGNLADPKDTPSYIQNYFEELSNPKEIYAAIKRAQYKIITEKGYKYNHNFTDEDVQQYLDRDDMFDDYFRTIKEDKRNQVVKDLLNQVVYNNQSSNQSFPTENNILPKAQNGGMLGIGKDLANLTVRGRIAKNLYPVGYHDSGIRLFESVLLNKKGSKRSLMDDLANDLYGSDPLVGISQRRLDALNMLMGFKQKYNSFEESKYRPSIGDNKNLKYYTLKDKKLVDQLIHNQNQEPIGNKNFSIASDVISYLFADYKISRGKDSTGNYTSFYDKWDIPGAWLLGVKAPRFYDRVYDTPQKQNTDTLKYQEGGVIRDNNGYWNPDNWGKPVEIASNNITMKGVPFPLLGVSDKGDMKTMFPGEEYKFEGNKVTEIPIAQLGVNIPKTEEDVRKMTEGKSMLEKLRLFNTFYQYLPDNLKELAKEWGYKIASMSESPGRTEEHINKADNYIGLDYTGNYGSGNRNLLRLALYGDESGFTKIPNSLRDSLKIPLTDKNLEKKAKNYPAYWLDAHVYNNMDQKINYNDSIPYDNVKNSMIALIDRNRKIKNWEPLSRDYVSFRADSILSSPEQVYYSTDPTRAEKEGHVFPPYKITDNISAHSGRFYRDKNKGLRFSINDIWDFDRDYVKRWKDAPTYYGQSTFKDIYSVEEMEESAKAMDNISKVIPYLMMDNPVSGAPKLNDPKYKVKYPGEMYMKELKQGGNIQYMSPGNDYKFKGSKVTEIPMFQGGGNMKKFQNGGEEELPSIYDRNHGDILQWWNNEFLKNEEFKSGILPTRYNLDKLNLPKKPALDFSKTGLPKDWRVLNALYNQSMNTAYLNGYPPKVSDEILNIAKLEQKEGLGKIMLDRAIFAGGDTKFQSKQYSPAFKYNEFGDIGYIKEGDPLTSRDIMNSNNLYYGNVDNTPFLYRYESYPLFFKKNYYDKNTGEPVFYGNDIPIVNEKLEWQGYKDAEYSIPRMYGYDPFNMSEENWNNLIKDVKTSIDKGGTSISGLVGRKNPWFGKQITMNKEQDPNFKLLNVSPEITEYNKKIVEKMKGIPSTFKHSQTSLQELIEEAPSLFSGQYKDKRLPFEGSVEKLKELAEKEKLSEQDIEYINTEMLRATALKESLAVRKNILARIENPSFVKALLNRNIKDEDKKELNWKEDNKEYNQQLHQFADMVPLIKSDLRNTGFTVQSDFRGDEFGNMAMRVPFTAGDNDLMQELRSEHKDMSDIALGFSPHYAGAHEYWHNIQRGGIPYKGGYRKMSNPEIVNPKLESFLKTYDPKVLDKYWESTDEFDADNFQLLYNIAYDPINRQKSVNKPLGTDINVKDIDSYFYDLDTSVKSNKMIKYDPAAERVGRMWSSSTPKQKLEYIKLLNNYYANGGQIKKQQGGQIKSNVQMKNQEQLLKDLTTFGNYNKKMKNGGWLDKFND